MPKRNLVLLCLIAAACAIAWAARRSVGQAGLYGEVTGHIRRSALDPVDGDALFRAAMDGIVSRLEGHAEIVPLDEVGASGGESPARVAGVGLELAIDAAEDVPVVSTPLVGSPAWLAGIATGDRIVSVDGVRTTGMRLKDVVAQLRGPAGTRVVLGIVPPAGEADGTRDELGDLVASRTATLERATLEAETVLGDRRRADGSWDWFVEGEDGVALLRVVRFDGTTAGDIDRACAEIAAAGAVRGLILDLRGSDAGPVNAAVDCTDRFLDDGVLVSTRRRAPSPAGIESRRALPGSSLPGVPIVVLVDGWTAGGAEIMAACLQDHGRAVVVGSRTFGRGTVQSVVPLSDGRMALRLTVSEYLRPSGSPIHRHAGATDAEAWGVAPDAGFEMAPTGERLEAMRLWRAARDAVPRHAAAEGIFAAESAAALPRRIDPALGRALSAIDAVAR